MEENKKNVDKIALIFCGGQSIDNLKNGVVVKLIKKFTQKKDENFTSVGINLFPIKFIEKYLPTYTKKSAPVDYWMFSDDVVSDILLKNYEKQKVIVNGYLDQKNLKNINEKCEVDFTFIHSDKLTKDLTRSALFGKSSTTVKAIHLFLLRGYKVVVIGMDNSVDKDGHWNHFYSTIKNLKKEASSLIDIRYQVKELTSLGEIYKIDESNKIDVPTIDINELLKGRIKKIDTTIVHEEFKKDIVGKPIKTVLIKRTTPLFIILNVPECLPAGGVLSVNGSKYEIFNRKVNVTQKDCETLLEQGYFI